MVNQIMKADGANEDFRSPLREVKKELNKKLLDIRHMSYTSAFRAMHKSDLDVPSILKRCKEEYRLLYDDGDWKSAVHAKDSKALNKNYGSVNAAATDELKKLINKVVQSNASGNGQGRDKSNDTCNNCEKKGH